MANETSSFGLEHWADPTATIPVKVFLLALGGILSFLIVQRAIDAFGKQKGAVEKNTSIDPSARLQQLLRALRFVEPDNAEDMQLLQIDPKKLPGHHRSALVQKAQPCTNVDSGQDTDDDDTTSRDDTEEEPEAEN